MREENDRLRSQVEEASSEWARVVREADETATQAQLDAIETLLARILSLHQGKASDAETAKGEIASLRSTVAAVQSSLNASEQEAARLRNVESELQTANRELAQQNDTLESEIRHLAAELSSAREDGRTKSIRHNVLLEQYLQKVEELEWVKQIGRVVEDIPTQHRGGFLRDLLRKPTIIVQPAQESPHLWTVYAPREYGQDGSWLELIHAELEGRMAQLFAMLRQSTGESYQPAVFELLRLLTEDLQGPLSSGVHDALVWICQALDHTLEGKQSVDVWHVKLSVRQICELSCAAVNSTRSLDRYTQCLRNMGRQVELGPCEELLVRMEAIAEDAARGVPMEDIRATRGDLIDGIPAVNWINQRCAAGTAASRHVWVIKVDEMQIWRSDKRLARPIDKSTAFLCADIELESPIPQWPGMVLVQVNFTVVLWWKIYVLKSEDN
ncbi:hypothetical protein F5Y17DRAFT_463908 [Xylariaceae sp. FL0594]|nr:hypothetical protein F5Y17DRAFT_463908 [Xylariaceae sp. FL0594]